MYFILGITFLIGTSSFLVLKSNSNADNPDILSHVVNPNTQGLRFYLKDETGKNYASLQGLKTSLEKENKQLVFAMNGGMYQKNLTPLGLYIEKGKTLKSVNTVKNAYGNFYLQPNGIFYLAQDNTPTICVTDNFKNDGTVKYATQSGPMLLIDGKIHPKFNDGSSNVHIRNGVGILPNGSVLFAMSKEKINLFDFATFFKSNGCRNALYLDGFVSRTYLPAKNWEQLDGNFGVIIAETKTK